jgi:hypothetical protein
MKAEERKTLIKLPWPAMKLHQTSRTTNYSSPLLNIFLTKLKPPTTWKQLCLGQAHQGIKSYNEKSHNGQKA